MEMVINDGNVSCFIATAQTVAYHRQTSAVYHWHQPPDVCKIGWNWTWLFWVDG